MTSLDAHAGPCLQVRPVGWNPWLFKPAYLPFFENQLQINLLLQARQVNRFPVFRRSGPGRELVKQRLKAALLPKGAAEFSFSS